MCIICLELQKGLLTPFEATRNLTEMVEQIDEDHLKEVFEIIMLQEEQEFCEYCDCNPCDCSWGED
jgi:hypothetical protein